jgi:hypothetical protein
MDKKMLNEMKFMMERLESPRMTDTEYQKRNKLIKESSEKQEIVNKVKDVVKSSEFDSAMEKAWAKMSPEEKNNIAKALQQKGIVDGLEEDMGSESNFNKAISVGVNLVGGVNESDEKTLKQKIGNAIAGFGKFNVLAMGAPAALLVAALGASASFVGVSVAAGIAVGGILWWLGDKISGEQTTT